MTRLPLPLSWISRDGRTIIASSGLRSFGVGMAIIVLGVYLADLGLSLAQIGAFFTAGAAGTALLTFAVAFLGDRFGRRTLFVAVTLVQAVPVLALVFSRDPLVLAAAAFFGTLGGVAGRGPVQPLEQASLAGASTPERRTDVFAVYRIVSTAAAALGSLAAGLAVPLESWLGLSSLDSQRALLWIYAVTLLLAEVLYLTVSHEIELTRSGRPRWTNPFKLPSRRNIFLLTGLFSLDNFAGQLIIQSLVAYWFRTRFGFEIGSLAWIFFLSLVLNAVSLWVAARIAQRIGLLNTMVFTHLPSNFLLFGVALAPVGWVAVVFWQSRAFFSQMDVPTRDSYTMAIVGPEERVAMAGVHLTGRSVAGIAGPPIATALWTGISAAAPFVTCGALKIAYDLALFAMFRNVRPPEEDRR